MEYNLDTELQIGDTVGTTDRIVAYCQKTSTRTPGDTYATWIAICYKNETFHPYAVWTIIARPEGWHAESGDYCKTLQEAEKHYITRGGHPISWEIPND